MHVVRYPLIALAALALLGACSSSQSVGFVETCNQPSGQGINSSDCSTCAMGYCTMEISLQRNACTATIPCWAACACSDTACISSCSAMANSACTSASGTANACGEQNCLTACGAAAFGDHSG